MKLNYFLILVVFGGVLPCFAYVYGGSNLGIFGYPDHTCSKPYKPFEFRDQYELDNYRFDYERYIDCINEYVRNGNNDIRRIQSKQQDAIREAESTY